MRIGVLAMQGGYAAHGRSLEALGHEVILVRTKEDLAGLEGLVFPGGESTTQLKLIAHAELGEALTALVTSGVPTLTTCAGLILAAKDVTGPEQASFGWLDIGVARNGWGRQVHSFEATAEASSGAPYFIDGFPLVFIRAPKVTRVGDDVEVLATTHDAPVLVRSGTIWGASFHPELTDDLRLHEAVFGRG